MKFNIGTFNVRGIIKELKRHQLAQDFDKYNLGILCIQETKITEELDNELDVKKFINIPSSIKSQGIGYIVAPNWKHLVHQYYNVSDGIGELQLSLEGYKSEIDKNNPLKLTIRKTEKYKVTTKGNKVKLSKPTKIKLSKQNPKHLISIINCYDPHSDLVKKNPKETEEFYEHFYNTLTTI